jgi:hypothetical protein
LLSTGDRLDRTSRVTAVVTLGGHHVLVLWLGVVAFAMLATLAVLTSGFMVAPRRGGRGVDRRDVRRRVGGGLGGGDGV